MTRIAIAMIWLVVSTSASKSEEGTLADVEKLSYRNLSRIASIQYRFNVTMSNGFSSSCEIAREGTKLMVSRSDGDVPFRTNAAPIKQKVTYDGVLYRQLEQSSGRLLKNSLTRGGTPSAGIELPELMLYAWLLDAKGSSTPGFPWADLHDATLWAHRFDGATLHKLNDSKVVVDFPSLVPSGKDCTYRVTFDRNSGMLPVQYERVVVANREVASALEVRDVGKYEADGEVTFLPLDIDFRQTHADGISAPLTMGFILDPISVSINKVISDDVFQIPDSAAKTIYDYDAVAALADVPTELQSPSTKPNANNLPWLICAGILGLAFFTFSLYRDWRRK